MNNCSKAIFLNDRNAKAYNVRGNILSDLGNNYEAMSNYNKAIQIDPNYVVAYNNRGLTY